MQNAPDLHGILIRFPTEKPGRFVVHAIACNTHGAVRSSNFPAQLFNGPATDTMGASGPGEVPRKVCRRQAWEVGGPCGGACGDHACRVTPLSSGTKNTIGDDSVKCRVIFDASGNVTVAARRQNSHHTGARLPSSVLPDDRHSTGRDPSGMAYADRSTPVG